MYLLDLRSNIHSTLKEEARADRRETLFAEIKLVELRWVFLDLST
jgi:hypothetical protein